MTVEDGADGIADGLIEIVTLDENGKEAGDGPVLEVPSPFADLGQETKNRGGVTFLAGRFAGSETDFTLGHGETGDGVHDEQNILTLISEEFGDCERDETGSDAEGCWLVGGGNDDDGVGHAFGSEVMLQKFTNFAISFADEGDDVDTGGTGPCHGTEERAFADAAASKYPDALAFTAGQEAVDNPDASGEALIDRRPGERAGGGA